MRLAYSCYGIVSPIAANSSLSARLPLYWQPTSNCKSKPVRRLQPARIGHEEAGTFWMDVSHDTTFHAPLFLLWILWTAPVLWRRNVSCWRRSETSWALILVRSSLGGGNTRAGTKMAFRYIPTVLLSYWPTSLLLVDGLCSQIVPSNIWEDRIYIVGVLLWVGSSAFPPGFSWLP